MVTPAPVKERISIDLEWLSYEPVPWILWIDLDIPYWLDFTIAQDDQSSGSDGSQNGRIIPGWNLRTESSIARKPKTSGDGFTFIFSHFPWPQAVIFGGIIGVGDWSIDVVIVTLQYTFSCVLCSGFIHQEKWVAEYTKPRVLYER